MADLPRSDDPGDPDDPDNGGPEEPALPALPPFFGLGGGVGAGFDPSQIDFSQVDLSQIMRMLQSTGPVNWEVARQTAEWVALEGKPEPSVAPADHTQFEELAHAAQTLVVAETGLTATFATRVETVGPKGWVDLHLVALAPVLEALASTLGAAMQPEDGEDDAALGDELAGLAGMPGLGALGGLAGMGGGGMMNMIAPALLGVQSGSMIGYLAQHAFGRYDLPLPTGPLPNGPIAGGDEPTLCFVVSNIDAFGAEWSLPRDDLRFAVALHEVVHAAERSVPWVRERLVRLAAEYVSSYEIDPAAFESEFGMIDPTDPESMQAMTSSPERVLGAMQSPRQVAPREELQRLTAVIEGYADHVAGVVGRRLVPTYDRINEAMQRHRVERGEAERFIEGLLGLKLERAHYEQGQAFVDGVVERAGMEGLNRLWESEAMLPTPNELAAPGLWLARIDLPT
ncbi:MAG: zinc-dependent metalloprotease [Acidimicrobiia bacterium]